MNRIIACFVFAFVYSAQARNLGQYAQVPQELRGWYSTLHSKSGTLCCADADGYDAQWDTLQGKYRVFSKEGWMVVPDDAVIGESNRAGVAKVWWARDNTGALFVRCFMPGLEG